ncbi:MAG: beta-lactamase family protein [bacterium]|nr:beta-lactamase family protein [bacterium]
MRLVSLVLLVCGSSALLACAQHGRPGSEVPQTACHHHAHGASSRDSDALLAFSAERLPRITSGLEGAVESGRVAGAVALVSRHGEIVSRSVVGEQDLEAGIPMREDTIFRIYSMSKPVTSVAAMILVEEGRLRLAEPVDRWLPELANPRVLLDPEGPIDRTRAATGPITVRDLLTHTSGLAYDFTSRGPISEALRARALRGSGSTLEPDEFMKRLGELPLLMDPGTQWHYGLSSDVLGVLVARVSGQSLPDFLEERIFGPLEMVDTGFFVPDEKLERFAVNYALAPEGEVLVVADHPRDSRYRKPPSMPSGGGGLVSTAGDYLRFARMMTEGGALDGVRILAPKSVALMTANALWPEERPASPPFGSRFFFAGSGFGLGVSVLEDPGQAAQYGSVGMHGWGGAAGTWYWSDPAEDLSAVMMIQVMNQGANSPLSRDFQKSVYQALETQSAGCRRGRGHRRR